MADILNSNGRKIGETNEEPSTITTEESTSTAEETEEFRIDEEADPETEKKGFKDRVKGFFGKMGSLATGVLHSETKLDPINGIVSGAIFKEMKNLMRRIVNLLNGLLGKLGVVGTAIKIAAKIAAAAGAGVLIGVVLVKAVMLLPQVLPVMITYAAVSVIALFASNMITAAFSKV